MNDREVRAVSGRRAGGGEIVERGTSFHALPPVPLFTPHISALFFVSFPFSFISTVHRGILTKE